MTKVMEYDVRCVVVTMVGVTRVYAEGTVKVVLVVTEEVVLVVPTVGIGVGGEPPEPYAVEHTTRLDVSVIVSVYALARPP